MKSKSFLTVEQFEAIPWKRLLIRCLIEDLPERVKTTIIIFTAEKEKVFQKEHFTMVSFVDTLWPGIFRPCLPLQVCSLRPCSVLRQKELQGILDSWQREIFHWTLAKQIVTCRKKGRSTVCLTPAVNLRILESLARFENKLADKMPLDQWRLSTAQRRLTAFIEEQNRKWERVLSI